MPKAKEKDITMLELYNTMSRGKEVFQPLDEKTVKMFTCGPSIYRRPHVGNYRTFLWEDVLQRYLEYLGYAVDRVLNLTDVEDKSLSEAARKGKEVGELTGNVADLFLEETRRLGIKLPKFIPRSSTTVDQAAKLVGVLLEKGYAYWDKGDVFFDPLKVDGFGRLYGLDMSRWPRRKKRFRKDTYPGTRWNLGDFILWHGYEEGDPVWWDTEIGRGRPSWNIQDPAVISKYLGFQVDICCGGIDNLWRHHDYNLAVMESLSGKEFARYWIHGEHLLVDGKKMSKSRGNILYLEALLGWGLSPQHARFYLIYGRHRERMNLTVGAVREARERLDALRGLVGQITGAAVSGGGAVWAGLPEQTEGLVISGFEDCMNNNLDVKGAVDNLQDNLSKFVILKQAGELSSLEIHRLDQELHRIDSVLQVIFPVV